MSVLFLILEKLDQIGGRVREPLDKTPERPANLQEHQNDPNNRRNYAQKPWLFKEPRQAALLAAGPEQ